MKKNTSFLSDLFIFLVILFFFLIPPFFAPQISENNSPFLAWHFPSRQLIYALFAFSLYFFYRNRVLSYEKRTINKIFRFPLIFTFSILFFIQLIFKVISISDNYFSQNQNSMDFQANILLPDTFFTWFFCILNFLFSAFFEEIIYRFYLPLILQQKLVLKCLGQVLYNMQLWTKLMALDKNLVLARACGLLILNTGQVQ